MKLPFDLGVKFFFRMIVPGAIVAVCLMPMLFTGLDLIHWNARHELGVAVAIMAGGWVLGLLDMPIYMVFEGRRFWPARVRDLLQKSEALRLGRVLKKLESADLRSRREASVNVREFPLDTDGNPEAAFPTRMGNLIAAFESYSWSRYGVEAIFFWPRIWMQLDKDSRESLDSTQAVADSALYCAFALLLGGAAWLGAMIVRLTGRHPLGALGLAPAGYVPNAAACGLATVGALCTAAFMYRAALFANAQYGEYFKAAFDVHVTRIDHFSKDILDVDSIVAQVEAVTGDGTLRGLPLRDKFTIAWRYLHNFRIKCPTCDKAIPVPQYASHRSTRHRAEDEGPAFEIGNLNLLDKNAWAIGHFARAPRNSSAVEVKWAHHEPGSLDRKPWSVCKTATTLSVLISGRFAINFRQAPSERVELVRPGHYVLFGPGVPHKSEALEDSVFLTLRWPSIAGDCETDAS